MDEGRHQFASKAESNHPRDAGLSSSPRSNLKQALRRARFDEAERTQAISDMRGAEFARLEMLEEALTPLLAELPENLDLFDVAIMPGEHPRLFIDMIGFVELSRDGRSYRLVQDTRHGRFVIAETVNLENAVEAVMDYMGRRLIEREKALAADRTWFPAQLKSRPVFPGPGSDDLNSAYSGRLRPKLFAAFNFLLDFLGSAAFFMLFAIGGFYASKLIANWSAVHLRF